MLMDPAIADKHHQKCDISSNQGILISEWSAVCDGSMKEYENKSFKELSECAKAYDLRKVAVNAWV